MADINEQICKAVDIIVSKKLESINFDSTIIATIVDNSEAEQYKYICSNGSSQFVAYAKETNYKINESVYVTIPNNDYDQQKIIIGKYVAKDAKPYIFKQPFETIIDLSGNLIQTDNTIANSLLANNISNIEYCENLNRNEISDLENAEIRQIYEKIVYILNNYTTPSKFTESTVYKFLKKFSSLQDSKT